MRGGVARDGGGGGGGGAAQADEAADGRGRVVLSPLRGDLLTMIASLSHVNGELEISPLAVVYHPRSIRPPTSTRRGGAR